MRIPPLSCLALSLVVPSVVAAQAAPRSTVWLSRPVISGDQQETMVVTARDDTGGPLPGASVVAVLRAGSRVVSFHPSRTNALGKTLRVFGAPAGVSKVQATVSVTIHSGLLTIPLTARFAIGERLASPSRSLSLSVRAVPSRVVVPRPVYLVVSARSPSGPAAGAHVTISVAYRGQTVKLNGTTDSAGVAMLTMNTSRLRVSGKATVVASATWQSTRGRASTSFTVQSAGTLPPAAPKPTSTATPRPTATPTSAPASPTVTNTPVAVAAALAAESPAVTDTPTLVPTDTPTPLPTDTPTLLPTDTPTPFPTATATATATPTDTPMPTATDTPVPTPTSTPVPTATSTPTPTATSTPTPTVTSTPTPTATSTPTPTSAPVAVQYYAASTPTPAPVTDCPGSESGCMQAMLNMINQTRAQYGLSPYSLNTTESTGTGSCIGSYGHSVHMAQEGAISHDDFPADICVTAWSMAENVGEAGTGNELQDLKTMHSEMMSESYSPGCTGDHACNILSTSYRSVGIGIYQSNGTTWLTEDFIG